MNSQLLEITPTTNKNCQFKIPSPLANWLIIQLANFSSAHHHLVTSSLRHFVTSSLRHYFSAARNCMRDGSNYRWCRQGPVAAPAGSKSVQPDPCSRQPQKAVCSLQGTCPKNERNMLFYEQYTLKGFGFIIFLLLRALLGLLFPFIKPALIRINN